MLTTRMRVTTQSQRPACRSILCGRGSGKAMEIDCHNFLKYRQKSEHKCQYPCTSPRNLQKAFRLLVLMGLPFIRSSSDIVKHEQAFARLLASDFSKFISLVSLVVDVAMALSLQEVLYSECFIVIFSTYDDCQMIMTTDPTVAVIALACSRAAFSPESYTMHPTTPLTPLTPMTPIISVSPVTPLDTLLWPSRWAFRASGSV